MPLFEYKAKAQDGASISGTLQAESERAAADVLCRQGFFPLEIRDPSSRNGKEQDETRTPRSASRRRPKADEVAVFTRQLSDLLRAGVPLHRALVTLERQTSNPRLSHILGEVGRSVSAGTPLHESLARHAEVFPPLYTNLVMAGETGGFLSDVLARLAQFIERDDELRARVKAALAYPVLLIILGTGAVAFLMAFFIPRFSIVFRDLGASLPASTRAVIAASSFLREYWVIPLAVLLLLLLLLRRAGESTAGRRLVDRFRLWVPLFGDVVRKNAIARFARTLGTLLRSGVPILKALAISRQAVGNAVLADEIGEAGAGVTQGRGLAEMLRRSGVFPPMVTDMIAVGEEGGNLDEVLITVADSYDRQVERAVRVFIALFEPFLLLVMACIVGFIVISMLLPVFTLSGMIR